MSGKRSISLLLSLAMVFSLGTPFPARALEQTAPVPMEEQTGEDISNRVVTGKMAGPVTKWNYAGTGTAADPYRILMKKVEGDPPNVAPNKFWGDPVQSFHVVFEQRQDDEHAGDLRYAYQFNTDESVEGTLNGRDSAGNRFRFTPYCESRANADGSLDIGFSWKGTFSTFWNDWIFSADVQSLSENELQGGDEVKVSYCGGYNQEFDIMSGWDLTYDIDFDQMDDTVSWSAVTTLDEDGFLTLSGGHMLEYGGNYKVEKVDEEPRPTAPAAPVLRAEAGDTQAVLSWRPVDGATAYKLYQDGTEVQDMVLDADTFGCTVTHLTNGQTYRFALTAVNEAGESDKSDPVTVIPKVEEQKPIDPESDAPAAPANVEAVGGHHMVELTWDAVSDADSYTIKQDGRIIKEGLTDTFYGVTGLTNGRIYSFAVLAVNKGGTAVSEVVKSVPNSAGPENSRPGGAGDGTGGGSSIPLAVQKTNASGSAVSSELEEIWLQFTHNVALRPENLEYVFLCEEGTDRELSLTGYVVDTVVDFTHRQFLFYQLNDALKENTTYVITVAAGVTAKNGMVTAEDQILTFTTAGTGGTVKPTDPDVEEEIKTETKPDGTVVVTTTHSDGSLTVVETTKDGSTSTTTLDKSGKAIAQVKLSEQFAAESAGKGEPAVLPMPALRVTAQIQQAPSIEVDAGNAQIAVTIPVTQVPAGAAAYLVKADGSRELVRKSTVCEDGVTLMISGKTTVLLVNNAKAFADTVSHWGVDAVAFASAHELFQGTSSTQFMPDASMTRAMLATVLWRMEDEAKAATAGSFADVAAGQWYTEAVNWAAEHQIVNGYGGSFAPDDAITRQQLAAMMYRYAGFMGLDTKADKDTSGFQDRDMIADWAADAMNWAVSVGLMSGKGNQQLDPAGTATRAEVAIICQRMIGLMVK